MKLRVPLCGHLTTGLIREIAAGGMAKNEVGKRKEGGPRFLRSKERRCD